MRRMRMLKSKTTALFAATLLMGLVALPASADKENAPPPPGAGVCEGVATVGEKDNSDQGLTFPVTDDGQLQPALEFNWNLLTTECEVVDGNLTTWSPTLDVSGTAEGWCGQSTAPNESKDADDNRGELRFPGVDDVNVWGVKWESVGSVLAVMFKHDGGDKKKGDFAYGLAAVDALGGDACLDGSDKGGATEFDVVITAELLTQDANTAWDSVYDNYPAGANRVLQEVLN